jgi:YD repeat-containing protein
MMWVIIAVLLLIAVAMVAPLAYLNIRLVRSGAYQGGLKTALSSAQVQSALGDGIRARQPVVGFLLSFADSQFAEWSVVLTGSRGSGRLYGVATEVNGVWEISRLAFESASGEANVELTPVRQLRLPSVPAKNVYLVPIGLAQGESVQWATDYYKSKLGIYVKLLPPVALDPKLIDSKLIDSKLIDPVRHQLNPNKCVDLLAEKYPEIARDPFSILVGVTSADMYFPGFNWSYAENVRIEGRYAIISTARLHPPSLLGKWNPEWLNSRLQKLLTKNLVMLYFDLPMSSDYTSLLSGGVLSGTEIDRMGGEIIGAEGQWDSFVTPGEPSVTLYDSPDEGHGDKLLWKIAYTRSALPDTGSQVFFMDLVLGLIVQRKADFVFPDEPALQFSRIHRNQDDRSRAFGIGGSNSFDIFLGGQMGVAVDLIMEDGARTHFVHKQPDSSGDIYQAGGGTGSRFDYAKAIYSGASWQVKTVDGWTYTFPYKPKALPQNVTVLTGFIDPAGQEYTMERDSFGSLMAVESPSGKWLHFENDLQHRIRSITSSLGRSVRYDYDAGGRMIRATDSEGHVDSYAYDEKGEMLTAAHGTEKPFLTNAYSSDGYIKEQILGDGRKFEYSYFRGERNIMRENQITTPDGLETYIQYVPGGYTQSLPAPVPQ